MEHFVEQLHKNMSWKDCPRWKHIKPPINCSHKYDLFAIRIFGDIWISHLG
jgi:hypothetical protein